MTACKRKNNGKKTNGPAEANRDKHINFVASELDENDPADESATGQSSKPALKQTRVNPKKARMQKWSQ
jgi:hypothetical protein